MMKKLENFLVSTDATIEHVIKTIQFTNEGIALVVDDDRHLLGTVTDGDIRRAILHRLPLHTSVKTVIENRPPAHPQPTVVRHGTSVEHILKLMEERVVRQIPILDDVGRVIDLALLSELLREEHMFPFSAVVMAGGEGQRLRPLTERLPKPMLPVNERPLMERTITQLKRAGVQKIAIAVNYKSEVITEYFGDGKNYGVAIDYITENQPLGTAGALGLMEKPTEPTLVINGDILTQLDFRALYDFHRMHHAVMTVGVRVYEFHIPYGVISTDDIMITNLVEKPSQSVIVNAGIYLLEPSAFDSIPKGSQFHMTDLIHSLIHHEQRVVSFPIQEYWLDVGHHEDYIKANQDASEGKC